MKTMASASVIDTQNFIGGQESFGADTDVEGLKDTEQRLPCHCDVQQASLL